MGHRIQQLFLFRTWAYKEATKRWEREGGSIVKTVDRWPRFYLSGTIDRHLLRRFKEWLDHSEERA